nr:hypothetical protein [Candidatus Prometheoarchaeum syntrophicum]
MKTIESKKDKINNVYRKKDLNHIWDEINESTTGIFLHYCMKKKKDAIYKLFSQPEPYRFGKGLTSKEEFKEKFPNFVIINLFDFPPYSVDSLKGIPQDLPNLSILGIISHEIKSLEGLPKELPNLKKLSINGFSYLYYIKDSLEYEKATKKGAPLSNLKGLPKLLPNLENLFISNSQIADISDLPAKLPSLKTFIINASYPPSFKGSLNSLRGIPNKLPSLERFGIHNCLIQTLELIPSSLPKLKKFAVTGCPLRNLRGFPKYLPLLEDMALGVNLLVSLEGLPRELPNLKKLNLMGNNLTSLKYFPSKLKINTRIEIQNNPLRSLCYLNHDFTFCLMFQYKKYKGFDLGPRFDEFINRFLTPYERIDEDTGEMETGQFYNMEIIDQIMNYYKKTTTELIQQYISDPNSISDDELERIIWEANIEDRNALESNFPSENVVIQKINQRLKFNLLSGESIFK